MAHDHSTPPPMGHLPPPANPADGSAEHVHRHGAHDHGHDHDHDHHHHHDHAAHASRTRLAWASVITGAFMLAEVVGGVLSGSLALLADAAHMLTDSASLLLAWFGFWLADKPADSRRSFGFSRFRILAAFANGLTLLLLAAWILVEAIQRFFEPAPVESSIMMGVAIVGLVINLIAFKILHGGDAGHDDVNLEGALWHVAGDLLGSVAAIIAAVVIMLTSWTPIDPLLSILVAGIAAWGGWRVVKRSAHILLEGAPDGLDVTALAHDLETHIPGVENIHHIHVWTLTGADRLVTLHARLASHTDAQAARSAIRNRLKTFHKMAHITLEIDTLAPDAESCCDCLPAPESTVHAH